jgi:hypothetical protein
VGEGVRGEGVGVELLFKVIGAVAGLIAIVGGLASGTRWLVITCRKRTQIARDLVPQAIERVADADLSSELIRSLLSTEEYDSLAKELSDHSELLLSIIKNEYRDDILVDEVKDALKDRRLVHTLARQYTALALRLATETGAWGKEVFLFPLIRDLLLDDQSRLYVELESSRDMKPVLDALFGDLQRVYDLWIPAKVTNAILEQIRGIPASDGPDPYNMRVHIGRNYWNSDDLLTCPVYASLLILNGMVYSALRLDYDWHVLLYVHTTMVVDALLENAKYDPSQNNSEEFATKYVYLVWQHVSFLTDWVRDSLQDYSQNKNVQLKVEYPGHPQNDNVPRTAVSALVRCVYSATVSPAINPQAGEEIIDVTLKLFADFRGYSDVGVRKYTDFLLKCLLHAGRHEEDYPLYRRALLARAHHLVWHEAWCDAYKELRDLLSY